MGKKKGKSKVVEDDDWEAELAAATAELGIKEVKPSKPKPKQEPMNEDADDDDDTRDPNRILTKSEKEKIKKEKEKQKKKEKAKKAKEKAQAEADGAANDETSESKGDDANKPTENDANDNDDDDDDDDFDNDADASSSSKKKKKKKKTAAEKAEKPKKASAMGALLKEKLRLEKEERERAEAEIAEKQRLIDEEEAHKQAEIDEIERKKQEKKDKAKAKIAQQKAEGTFMTKAQKKKQAEREAALERMKAIGFEVPTGEKDDDEAPKQKKAVYTKKKKTVVQTSPEELERQARLKREKEKARVAAAKAAKAKRVAEDWEQVSSSEEEEEEEEDDDDDDNQEDDAAKQTKDNATETEAAAKTESVAEEMKDSGSAAEDYGGVAVGKMRSPIVTVLGHVDTGKTKILDKIRKSSVQAGEAGGITQQIGASYFPVKEIQRQTEKVKQAVGFDWDVPGLLIMDTPGHESFSNLRDRGSSLCNIAILVVDIMHGIENQTLESINLLKKKRVPFIVALNKIDVLHQWKPTINGPIQNSLKKQKEQTREQFDVLCGQAKMGLQESGLNADLYWENKNDKEYINIVPTSAHTGEGIPDLLFLMVKLSQKMLSKQITFTGNLNATVLEVKKIDGYGTTIDVILADGQLKEGDQIVMAGVEGPIVTNIRSLLMPEPLKEMRVKNAYRQFKSVPAANGVKLSGRGFDNAIPGLKLYVSHDDEEAEALKILVMKEKALSINSLMHKNEQKGVHVQASTIGSMEALLSFLKDSKIPVSGVSIGPVTKKDVTKASIQLERDRRLALILAFDVTVEREAMQYANSLGIKIFEAMIIYNLFDMFTKHVEDEKARLKAQFATVAIFPCVIKIMPDNIFNTRDPIIMGVVVEKGQLRVGAKLTVDRPPEFCDLGVVTSLEFDNKPVEVATVGQEVCVKIEAAGGDKKLFGRHFTAEDKIISRITRQSIDALKEYFKDELKKADIVLLKKMKDKFEIM